MCWLDDFVIDNANRRRIQSPIFVADNPENYSSIQYLPTHKIRGFPIGIKFGWDVMLMDRECLARFGVP
jgi:hypothetical protein